MNGIFPFLWDLPVPLAFLAQDQRLLKPNPVMQSLLHLQGAQEAGKHLADVLRESELFQTALPKHSLLQHQQTLQDVHGQVYQVHFLRVPNLEVAGVPVRDVLMLQHTPTAPEDEPRDVERLRRNNRQLEQQLVEVSTRLALLEWSLGGPGDAQAERNNAS
jgi:hypothetical protein